MEDLFKNNVPEDLKDRLEFSHDEMLTGTTREVYVDKITGDSFASGILPAGSEVINYRILETKVRKYKCLSYLGAGKVEFFFDGEQTNGHTFWSILENQTKLPDSKKE